MHENAPTLAAVKRERVGTRYARRHRGAGKLPAVVYGHGQEPVAIALDAKSALTLIHKGEKVFKLDFPGTDAMDEGQVVLLKDVQFDYLGTNVVHADFVRVDLNERITTKVHIALVGEPRGLKTAGAILMHPNTEIEIECRVTDIPDSIEVTILDLEVGQTITAAQVKLPSEDMRLVTDSHAVIAQITLTKEQTTGEAATVGADAAQPEVITAKKPEEGDAKKDDKKK